MKGILKRKTTRELHGDKICRLRIDIPYSEISNEGSEGQDVHQWLDHKVGSEVSFTLGDIFDEDQRELSEVEIGVDPSEATGRKDYRNYPEGE